MAGVEEIAEVDEDHEPTLSTDDVVIRAGVSFRQLDYWDRCGVVQPKVAATGSGSVRRWTPAQARAAWLVARLYDFGAKAPVVANVAKVVESWPRSEWDRTILVDRRGNVLEVFRALKRQEDGWLIDLRRVSS